MALTKKRRDELAEQLDVAASWVAHTGRSAKLRAIAAELRGEDVDDDTAEAQQARLEAAEKAEAEAHQAAVEQAEAVAANTPETPAKKTAAKKAAKTS